MTVSSQPDGRLAELERTLGQVVPVLATLYDHNVAQRQALAEGDLRRVITLTAEHEDAAARLGALEQRRAALQQSLEGSLGVSGLREIVAAGSADQADRVRFLSLLDEVGQGVARLREAQNQSAALLGSAIETARRTRSQFERLAGVQASYSPAAARRVRAMRQSGASTRPAEIS